MNKIKKAIIFCLSITIFIAVYLLLLYGYNRPLNSITGCYFQNNIEPYDQLCIYEDGSYEQFSQNETDKFESYNSGKWRKYTSKVNSDHIVGVTLSDYFDRFEDQTELDIFPYQNMFNKELFVTGSMTQQLFYVKKQENQP